MEIGKKDQYVRISDSDSDSEKLHCIVCFKLLVQAIAGVMLCCCETWLCITRVKVGQGRHGLGKNEVKARWKINNN